MVYNRLPKADMGAAKAYRVRRPDPEYSRRNYCREAGDERIREHIRGMDEYDLALVAEVLIEKGALVPV